MQPVITLLTDFGTSDHYVAAMKGVLLSICPEVRIVDITHEISPYGILEEAYKLSQCWLCFPAGTIHVVVVDPGVGGSRLPILVEAGGHFFVGPDNGVFSMVLAAVGGFAAREITSAEYFRHPVSRTFHGRDIFAPVAAYLGQGIAPERLGDELSDPVRLPGAVPVEVEPAIWVGSVLAVDRFGNIVTSFRLAEFGWMGRQDFELSVGSGLVARYCETYAGAPVVEPFVIGGSGGYMEVSIREASASSRLGASAGAQLHLKGSRSTKTICFQPFDA